MSVPVAGMAVAIATAMVTATTVLAMVAMTVFRAIPITRTTIAK